MQPVRDGQRCALCGRYSKLTSATLAVCLDCIRGRPEEAGRVAQEAHGRIRRAFGLPAAPPRKAGGLSCVLCVRECSMAEGDRGYCGLRAVRDGRLVHLAGTRRRGLLAWYRDPLPTNCVADWVCAGSSRVGFHNLAVFYASCTLNCLFCQNWHFRETSPTESPGVSADQLAQAANAQTYCVCFFGGDPASQMPHALVAGRQLARKGVVVCWETAGTSSPRLLDQALQLSMETGGCVKFDLKAYDETLHLALTGCSNRRALENFARAAARFDERPDPPPVVASTLLVPGYVDEREVERISMFLAGLDKNIPYSLLVFHPGFMMSDLPVTPYSQVEDCYRAAKRHLVRVNVGNLASLGLSQHHFIE